ncbi:hypothetical protein BV22DRAFT_1134361 [Leucogyrophana mollusca]|uniref:Uncharacterized protein n=1 Tax=Leucogyrophana mollusca TaxID=85980 RepID=A0ACB8AZA5_9AGAM|nr:hypothetical protein BV22DRAFT_1134361 [Leucogyrophana mollusca]
MSLNNLTFTLFTRPKQFGDRAVLGEAIELLRAALALRPQGHPNNPASLNNPTLALCYSIACPQRQGRQARLSVRLRPGLKKRMSREAWGIQRNLFDTEKSPRRRSTGRYTLFVTGVSPRRVWINGLKDSDIIPAERRTDFLQWVFWNIHEIIGEHAPAGCAQQATEVMLSV